MSLALTMVLTGIAIPLVVLGLHAAIPTGGRALFGIRTLAIALLLIAAALVAMWLFPPWWTPWAYLAALALIALAGRPRIRTAGPVARSIEGLVSLALIALAVWVLVPAVQGRAAGEVAIDLAPPLEPGRYLVVNGGGTTAINAHRLTLAPRFADYRGQSAAVDIVGLTSPFDLHAPGIAPRDPTRYPIFGADILAPCAGRVMQTGDGMPDMPVPEMDRSRLEGNHVILRCDGTDLYVLLAHMSPGSLQVAEGESVGTGRVVGKVGNSGNTSTPHLHIHVQRGLPEEAPISGEPVAFTIAGDYPVRNMRLWLR